MLFGFVYSKKKRERVKKRDKKTHTERERERDAYRQVSLWGRGGDEERERVSERERKGETEWKIEKGESKVRLKISVGTYQIRLNPRCLYNEI